jgi:hypothetical protein
LSSSFSVGHIVVSRLISRIVNQEKLATLGTQDTGQRKKKHNTESKKQEQHGPNKTPVVNGGALERSIVGYFFLRLYGV